MARRLKIYLMDEVNAYIEGLTKQETKIVIDRTKLPVKGAYQMASYQLKIWDGKESLFRDDGFCFQYMLPQVLDILEELGLDESDIEWVDERLPLEPLPEDPIGSDFLWKETGFELHDYQEAAINASIQNRCGLLSVATSGGKSLICLGLSKYYDKRFKVVVMTQSKYLIEQLLKDYQKTDLNYIDMGKVPVKKRKAMFEAHDHIIMTHKLLLSMREIMEDGQHILIYDEAHSFGEETQNVFRVELRNCPVRIGMTGSIPPDKLKREKIFCHFGGGALVTVKAKELIERGIASSVDITMIATESKELDAASMDSDLYDWDSELGYINNNHLRLDIIAEYIKELPKKNTMILCNPQAGTYLCQYFDGKMITDVTPVEDRVVWLKEFETCTTDDYYLCSSFGTTGTGVSINNVQRIVLIDIGKEPTTIKQCIGRGMRLDGKENHTEIIDIGSNTRIGKNHARERKKLYRKEGHPFVEGKKLIIRE